MDEGMRYLAGRRSGRVQQLIAAADFTGPLALVMGSEGLE